ncbi:F-box/FBD/LRR-repeat protein At1g13570-like isoform X2 [Panicum virgatum]|uniref:F-box/FBD/LRR-repeat protein At1g13570-like isoform X2 n=1 Tax=Panicum virgatum TaxID=38727 RepID=UPI0019D632D6|nr:F-box/FBD/LRR-repeat protein At1g13570-like isoform X2 [Panicum virgatum]
MGMLSLNHLMLKQKRWSRRRTQALNGSTITLVPQKDLLCQEGGERSTYLGPNLPEDIWCRILSLMSLQDAAQSASISHTFLRSWRCYPYLNFTKETLKQNASGKDYIARRLIMTVDQILTNHSGIGVKTLRLSFPYYCEVDACQLNRWLQIAITPGIEEVTLFLPPNYKKKYSFPCSLLFGGCGNSIKYIRLTECAFHPPVGFVCLRSLTKLHLYQVRITGDELGSLVSNCFALEKLELKCCDRLIFLKIPLWLERLSFLVVSECYMLQVIESKAPNLFTFRFFGGPVRLSLGESSHVKNLDIQLAYRPNSLLYAITELPSAAPNLETLTVTSVNEIVNTPMAADKFLNLKYLRIHLTGFSKAFCPDYDYLSLVSFLDASPTLETFILSVKQNDMKHDSVFGNALHVGSIPAHKHSRLRKVQIIGFCSAKSMVELTCHILENATSLESLTLDTIFDQFDQGTVVEHGDCGRRCVQKYSGCGLISREMILEAHEALRVVSIYIIGRVPPAVQLNVRGPCSQCHKVP